MAAVVAVSSPAIESHVNGTVSVPLGISAGVGLRLGPEDGSYRPVVEADAGLGGARVSVGVDCVGRRFGSGVRAAMLWTWLEPVVADEDQTLLGVEVLGSYRNFVVHAGVYARVEGEGDDFAWGAGIGWRF